jgi:cell division protein FtsW
MNRRIDLPLFWLTLLLVAIGLVSVFSASSFHDGLKGNGFYHLERQGLATVAGLVAMFGLSRVPYRKLSRHFVPVYVASIVMLALVFVPGVAQGAKGANRWIGFGGINFQPAEFVKVVVVVHMSAWMAKHRGGATDARVLGVAGLFLFLPLLGIILQPDFGSFAIICTLVGLVVFLAGLPIRYLAGAATFLLPALLAVAWAADYRQKRLLSFIDPFKDCAGDGYQVCQSLLAFHHGGLAGQGIGNSQAKLKFLPEPHNDFIAAVIGEETGLVGMFAVFALYGAFAWRGTQIARRAPDMFGSLMATTFTAMIAGQACLNLGVALSLVPPKGLVLPFMSYGASAMIVNLAAVGILLSISAEAREPATQASTDTAPAPGNLVGA